MPGKVLISIAYLPPVEYFSLISGADEVFIEANENYIKQSYRSRCYILSSHGPQMLPVPVIEGSRHKIPVRQARIDYSKKWQQVHLRGMASSYRCSPYFDFYYETIEKIISARHELLWELNMKLLEAILKMMKIRIRIRFTADYEPAVNEPYDYRYRLDPAKTALAIHKEYMQVFKNPSGFVPNLSIVDLIFNQGPDSVDFL